MFIELNINPETRILVNTSTVCHIQESPSGRVQIFHDLDNHFTVMQSFDEVIKLLNPQP